MSRYVLLFRDAEPTPDDLERITSAPGVTVLDHSISRAMLLEGSDIAVATLRDQLSGWIVARQVTYPPPEPSTEHLATPRNPETD
jgi:hypothetical protein